MSADDLGGFGPDTVATPEGDNEFAPDQPPKPVDGLETPLGSAPDAYKSDAPSELEDVLEAIDEVSRGKIQP